MFTLIFAASSLSFAPPGPSTCLKNGIGGYLYQLVIPGACYYNLQLEGDVWACNVNEDGICLIKWCDISIEGCSYHAYEDPIEI